MTDTGYGGTSLVALAIRAIRFPVVLALLSSGCFFHLADPIPDATSGGAAGTGGAPSDGGAAGSASGGGGASAGGAGGAGAGATGGASNCQAGAKRCGNDCVQIDDPTFGCSPTGCQACPQVGTANTICLSGKCAMTTCLNGHGDCDGADDNGCEINFDALPQSSGPVAPFEAFRTTGSITLDGLGTDPDWIMTTARRQPIADICRTCTTQDPIPKVLDPTAPAKEDLQAWFRTAWDGDFLYALIEVRDDDLVDKPANTDNKYGASVLEDAVEILVSSDRSHGGLGPDDKQLFFGLDGMTIGRPDQKTPIAPEALFAVTKGHGCYTLELKLFFQYITTNMSFFPMPGQVFGFTAAINDWDYLRQTDGGRAPERHWHVFSKDPGDQYWNNADSFATLTLVGPQ